MLGVKKRNCSRKLKEWTQALRVKDGTCSCFLPFSLPFHWRTHLIWETPPIGHDVSLYCIHDDLHIPPTTNIEILFYRAYIYNCFLVKCIKRGDEHKTICDMLIRYTWYILGYKLFIQTIYPKHMHIPIAIFCMKKNSYRIIF